MSSPGALAQDRKESTVLLPLGVDSGYYTARETAGRTLVQANSLPSNLAFEMAGIIELRLPPQSIQSGYIFTPVDMGTKSFNVDVVGDDLSYMMTFFVPVPGLKLDHYEVDASKLYQQDELESVDLQQLVRELEAMPCCVRDAAGKDKGDPLNLVFVGETRGLPCALMRPGWDETETIHGKPLMKAAVSATAGGRYRYSPVSAPYDNPRGNLTGDPYFTDGRRVVMWIANEPSSIAEIEIVKLVDGN